MKRTILVLLLVAAIVPLGVHSSAATFVSSSSNNGTSFTAAADFNTVAVAFANPGSPLSGTVGLTATASSNRPLTSVVFQSSPAGLGSWTTICTDTGTPFTCSFDTTSVVDGLRDLRALATDNGGYSRTSTVTNRRIDNTSPVTAVTDPGTPLTGNVTINGTAVDTGSGLTNVKLQFRGSTGVWTDICSQATSPAACTWNTTTVADGLYDLRTQGTDAAGNVGTSTIVANRRIDNNNPTVTMTDPGAAIRGTVSLQSTTGDGNGSGVQSVLYQYKPSASATWVTACTSATTPFSCNWNTTVLAAGLYDLRAIATDGVAKVTTSATVTNRRIDNTAPTAVTMVAVGTPITANVTFSGTALDTGGSGIASIAFQTSPAGTNTWTDACVDTTAAYSCNFATTARPDGLYDLRALASDLAGNTTASAVQTNRRIDNDGPVAVVTSPGAYARGTITFGGTATDPVGVTTTTFQYRPVGSPTWTTTCVDTTVAYGCAADTTGVPNGSYELRMQATDTLGHVGTSPTVTTIVDNTAPTGTAVQGANGGTAGTVDNGDNVTFTWSEPILATSILAGWNGAATPVRVRMNNNGGNDTLEIFNAAGTLELNAAQSVTIADYASGTTWFNGSMLRSVTGNQVTVTIGTLISGTPRTGVTTLANMTWTPSTGATDLAGNPATANNVNEAGGLDRDF